MTFLASSFPQSFDLICLEKMIEGFGPHMREQYMFYKATTKHCVMAWNGDMAFKKWRFLARFYS